MTITAKQLGEDDWQILRDTRLTALHTDPNVFASNYDIEVQFSEENWKKNLRNPNYGIFAVYDDGKPIALTNISIDKNDTTGKSAFIWGSWIAPEYRGRGLSQLLYDVRFEWAMKHPTCEKLTVSHRDSNVPSRRAIEQHGFVFTRREPRLWNDNITEDEVFYELKIK